MSNKEINNRPLLITSIVIGLISIVLSVVSIIVSFGRYDIKFNYVEILTTIFSFIVSVLIAWQIWTSINLKSIVYDNIDKAKQDLEMKVDRLSLDLKTSGAKSLIASLYKSEGINLKLNISSGYVKESVEILKTMCEYAIGLDDYETIKNYAGILANSIILLKDQGKDYKKEQNSFLELSQLVLKKLSASEEESLRLLHAVKSLSQKD